MIDRVRPVDEADRQATRTLVDSVDRLRATPGVDPTRIAVWGYCTGGTMAWLAELWLELLGADVRTPATYPT